MNITECKIGNIVTTNHTQELGEIVGFRYNLNDSYLSRFNEDELKDFTVAEVKTENLEIRYIHPMLLELV